MIDFLKAQQINVFSLLMMFVFCLLLVVMYRAGRDNTIKASCIDLLTSPDGRLSRTAIGQTLGIVLAVFAPAYTTMQDKLDVAVLTVCLTYLGLVEGYAKWLRYKNDQQKPPAGTTP